MPKWSLRKGTCANLAEQLPKDSIDLVITDPPYGKEYLDCYRELKAIGPAMKPGASMLILTGHNTLPQILDILSTSLYLKFHWMIAAVMGEDSSHSLQRGHGVMVYWKPILWYVKGRRIRKDMVRDSIRFEKHTRTYHEWEQPLDWISYYVDKLTEQKDMVLDPFMGAGGAGVIATTLNRDFIGFDIEEDCIKIAKKRIAVSMNAMNGRPYKWVEQTKFRYDTAIGWPHRNK